MSDRPLNIDSLAGVCVVLSVVATAEADVVGEGEGVSVDAGKVRDFPNEASGVGEDAVVGTGGESEVQARLPGPEVGGGGDALVVLGKIPEVQRPAWRSRERREG